MAIPQQRLAALTLVWGEAQLLALEERAAEGYQYLLTEWRAAEQASDGEEWAAALMAEWRVAGETFARWWELPCSPLR